MNVRLRRRRKDVAAAGEPSRSAKRKPLRIALCSFYLPSESKIGAGHMAHRLANTLSTRGHDVTVFSPCSRPTDARYRHRHVVLVGKFRILKWARAVGRLDLSDFDVVNAWGDNYLRLRRTPPLLRTMAGSCFSEARYITGLKERLRMLFLGFSEIAGSAMATRTVAISENTRRHFPWIRDVIFCGVDHVEFHPGDKENRPVILFVGTYRRRKRGRLLMEIFQREILPAVPSAELWMVSSDAPAAPSVVQLGYLSDQDLADRYRRAWVFCLPSTYEGFGVPYIEAMASGTAVVASPNPGAIEVLAAGDYGVVVQDDRLGSALISILTDHDRRVALEASGLERSQHFDWDTIAAAYERNFEELIWLTGQSTRRSRSNTVARSSRRS